MKKERKRMKKIIEGFEERRRHVDYQII